MSNTQQYQIILVQPQGRLDLQGSKALETQLRIVTNAHNAQTLLIIDLEQVEFMDSSGLVAVAKALKMARTNNCRLVLCNLQPPVKLIFELTQLDSVFEIFDNYAAAKATVEKIIVVA
ncbi:STAS domain-containing protein [Synechocystis sp. PCC 7509]|uniref:STAS domain-containing protein n=1 Tax=Synechocystis sp. PCC 7509 TaxID=927677 RepID=UPI0002ABB2AE|nr:STAS domain-containing protein [Synechocystis sp. PCC 7509]